MTAPVNNAPIKTIPNAGMRQYLYEYLIYRSIDEASRRAEERGEKGLTTSHRNLLRDRVADQIAAIDPEGVGIASPRLGFAPVFQSLDTVLQETYPGQPSMFTTATSGRATSDPVVMPMYKDFIAATNKGQGKIPADGYGERLLISPHDPRWRTRSAVMSRGNKALSLPLEELQMTLNTESLEPLANAKRSMQFMTDYPETDRLGQGGYILRKAGKSNTLADQSGFARLRPFMTKKEAQTVEPWAHQVAYVGDNRFMDSAAVDRSVAVLEDLSSRGVNFTIERDMRPGQLRAVLPSGMAVRIMDTAENQAYVANSIYDGGKKYTYSINTSSNDLSRNVYTPTPEQAVKLVQFAEGRNVLDDNGFPIGMPADPASGIHRAYHNTKSGIYHVGQVTESKIPFQVGLDLRIKVDHRSPNTQFFNDPDIAREQVQEWIGTAKHNMVESFGIDEMVALANDPDRLMEEPNFSMDDDIASVQRAYWSQIAQVRPDVVPEGHPMAGTVLAGTAFKPEPEPLLMPDVPAGAYEVAVAEGDTWHRTANYARAFDEMGDEVPVDPVEAARRHAADYTNAVIGQYEVDAQGKRFDSVAVSKALDPGDVRARRNDLIAALQVLPEVEVDHLKGDDFYNDTVAERMVRFNPDTAVPMQSHPHPMAVEFARTIYSSIQRNGADVMRDENGNFSIYMDDQGVVSYTAQHRSPNGKLNDRSVRTCQIGQIFLPGEHGEITTKFAHGKDYMFIPGYEASIVPQKPGEDLSVEERTVLRGYKQIMNAQLAYMVRDQLNTGRNLVLDPSGVNKVYKRLYGHQYDVDFLQRTAEEGLDPKWQEAILKTESARVHYDKEIGDGASQRSKLFADRSGVDYLNDLSRDALVLTEGRDMTTLHAEEGAGYFDPEMTGSAGNHGQVRYLVDSAEVDAHGRIIKGDENDRAALMKMEELQYSKFDPHSRKNMMLGAILQASSVNEHTNVAMMDIRGWTIEDAVVVSKNYAEDNVIRATDGNLRPLMVGDKVTDMHGNKGVIGLIVDPEMDPETAREQNLEKEVKLFADNPDLDVVMAPFSAISRANAGSARELIDSKGEGAKDLIVGDQVVEGGMGTTNMVITHMAVDRKTNMYDDEAIREGRGRKASSQLAWALQSQGCEKVMEHLYQSNTPNVAKAREFLVATGFDMLPTGEIQIGYNTELSPEREQVGLGSLEDVSMTKSGDFRSVDIKKMKADISRRLQTGGEMILPFPLEMASGEQTRQLDPDPVTGRPRYGLPVLSAALRSEQELHDGTVSSHEYTDRYADIYVNAMRYEMAWNQSDDATSQREQMALEKKRLELVNSAQGSYNSLANEIVSTKLEGKHNIYKELLMTSRADHSATAVWTPDPRLSINQVAMNSEMAATLGVARNGTKDCFNENSVGHTMLWRDPVWSENGVRYMEVVIDDNLTGVAVNPVIAQSFDGDYDGDAVGLIGNLSKQAHEEACNRLTMEANLLNRGTGQLQPDGSYRYDLSTSSDLDVAVAMARDPELKERYEEIVDNIHENLHDFQAGDITEESYRETNKVVVQDLNEFYRDALSTQMGDVSISFKDALTHVESVKKCYQMVDPETGEVTEHKAKGNEKKYQDYEKQIGVEEQEGGRKIDRGVCLVDEETLRAEQMAMGIKTESVGDAGTKSHRAVTLTRGQGLIQSAALMSYAATQSILQAKKDAVDAIYREEVVSTAVGELWNGTKFNRGENEQSRLTWTPVVDANGNKVQATRNEWVEQYMDMYTSDKGMGVVVGRDLVEKVADALSDENGIMHNLERAEWENLPENKQPLAMDRLAYGGKFDDLKSMAGRRANLFAGVHSDFAPRTIRENLRAIQADNQAAVLKSIDTQQTRVQEARVQQTRVQQAQKVENVQGSIEHDDAVKQLTDLGMDREQAEQIASANDTRERNSVTQAQVMAMAQPNARKQADFEMDF